MWYFVRSSACGAEVFTSGAVGVTTSSSLLFHLALAAGMVVFALYPRPTVLDEVRWCSAFRCLAGGPGASLGWASDVGTETSDPVDARGRLMLVVLNAVPPGLGTLCPAVVVV